VVSEPLDDPKFGICSESSGRGLRMLEDPSWAGKTNAVLKAEGGRYLPADGAISSVALYPLMRENGMSGETS
jgi:hypothetical protein